MKRATLEKDLLDVNPGPRHRAVDPAGRSCVGARRRIHMRSTFVASLAALACLTPTAGLARGPAARSGPYRLEVLDEAGRPLPSFSHDARSYVLGALGQRYLLRL